jgi:rubrerythrin
VSACEECWQAASLDVLMRGGSIVDHYHRRLDEVKHADQHSAPFAVELPTTPAEVHLDDDGRIVLAKQPHTVCPLCGAEDVYADLYRWVCRSCGRGQGAP